jgi:homoserine O-acetyltransferase/O-succinyltransferase
MKRWIAFAVVALTVLAHMFGLAAVAADYPTPKTGEWVARDFRFHTGEVMPELRLHYTTVGDPSREPVLVLHGTTGSAGTMLTPAFAGPPRRVEILHRHTGRDRTRAIIETL